ncbi:MAG: acetolactate synthase small subunit [Euryarchaeota archaeon]
MRDGEKRRILSVLVRDRPGVMQRVSGLFRRRGFNIDSIAEGPSEREGLARMTLTVRGDERTIEQIVKQLNKLVDVIKVSELDPERTVERQLALVKIKTRDRARAAELARAAGAEVVDVGRETITVEIVGEPRDVESLLELMNDIGSVVEIARTGIVAMERES